MTKQVNHTIDEQIWNSFDGWSNKKQQGIDVLVKSREHIM